MTRNYRIIFEAFDAENPNNIERTSLLEGEIKKPTDCLDFSLAHEKQIELLQAALDKITSEKSLLINQAYTDCVCPKCSQKLMKMGKHISTFHDLFTDHDIAIKRLRCSKCNYEPPSTVKTLLGTNISGELAKMQAELGASHSFRASENIFAKFSTKDRNINNHNRIKLITESVGEALQIVNKEEKELTKIEPAKEIIVSIDGGHIPSKDPDSRSFEAITSVVYRPESVKPNKKNTRNTLESKGCAASAKEDQQEQIIADTILAALKEGMTSETNVTAICDGATNCWNVIEALRPICAKMTSILDWFHIAMKMEKISFPEELKVKFVRIKWHLWRGNVKYAILRLEQLIEKSNKLDIIKKLKQFLQYIKNNKDKIVNYRERKKKGLVFTSNLAESTVESLINQRCKGKKHMRWTREGLHPILQIRAKINSQDWENKWKTVILQRI